MPLKHSLGANPFLYPQPVLLITTYDENNQPNIMTAAWGGICNSEPPSVTVGIRPARLTHTAILSRKAFTIGIATKEIVAAADYVGMISGRRQNKFATAELTAVPSNKVDAPYIAECPVILECTLTNTVELGTHTVIIGKIEDIKADASCLNEENVPDLGKFCPLIYDEGTKRYFGIGDCIAKSFSVGKPLIQKGK